MQMSMSFLTLLAKPTAATKPVHRPPIRVTWKQLMNLIQEGQEALKQFPPKEEKGWGDS